MVYLYHTFLFILPLLIISHTLHIPVIQAILAYVMLHARLKMSRARIDYHFCIKQGFGDLSGSCQTAFWEMSRSIISIPSPVSRMYWLVSILGVGFHESFMTLMGQCWWSNLWILDVIPLGLHLALLQERPPHFLEFPCRQTAHSWYHLFVHVSLFSISVSVTYS